MSLAEQFLKFFGPYGFVVSHFTTHSGAKGRPYLCGYRNNGKSFRFYIVINGKSCRTYFQFAKEFSFPNGTSIQHFEFESFEELFETVYANEKFFQWVLKSKLPAELS